MKYDLETKILTMSQIELENCGFSWADDGFFGELYLSGMGDAEIEEAKKCHTIVVSMHVGLYG